MTRLPRDEWRHYNGCPSRADRLAAWFHAKGQLGPGRGPGARLLGGASWVIWMNLFVARHRMSAGNRGRALGRLWLWQAWRRLIRRPIVVDVPGGTRMYCPPWSRLAGALATIGLHEPEETLFVGDLLRSEDGFIDVGANLGVYTLVAAARGAHVVAFEPGDGVREVLACNLRLNGLVERVSVQALAVADFSGPARFSAGLDVGDHLLETVDEPGGRAVQATTLDEFFKCRRPWPSGTGVTVLKVDAEGADERVLLGASRLIEEEQPVVIVEAWEGGRPIRSWLEGRGYGVYRYRLADRRLERIPAGFQGQANFIAVAAGRLAWAGERLAGSSRPPLSHPRIHWRPDLSRLVVGGGRP